MERTSGTWGRHIFCRATALLGTRQKKVYRALCEGCGLFLCLERGLGQPGWIACGDRTNHSTDWCMDRERIHWCSIIKWRFHSQCENRGSNISTMASTRQVIKADSNGVFTYAMSRAGWWGFAALIESDAKSKSPEGRMAPTEPGAVIWVKTIDM